jgi:Aspartyl protease
MRFLTFCSAFITVGIFFFHFAAAAQTADTTSVPIRMVDGTPVVQVRLNGKGPYDFILDTGSNRTAIQPRILAQLSVPLQDRVDVDTALDGSIHERRATIESISVGDVSVSQMYVDTFNSKLFSQKHQHIAGLLGESFLKHFDILLDNDKKILVLDRTSRLSYSFAGEHLPFSRFGVLDGGRTLDRIVIELKMRDYLEQPLRCLVDSGARSPMLFPEESQAQHLQTIARPSSMATLGGERCIVAKTSLVIGATSLPAADVFSCGNITRKATDTDCLLPTYFFKQIFISHTNSYIIVNLKKVSLKLQELADTVPLAR